MADVICESVTSTMIRTRHLTLAGKCLHFHNNYGIVDPRATLREAKCRGTVYTLVTYDQVLILATSVVKKRLEFNHKQQ